jgi:molybdate transport system ATP-binding protein
MIEIRDVHTVRSGKKVFNGLSWTIGNGEHWVITGSNGSGKTSLLELISGKQHPMSGTVDYDFVTGDNWDDRYEQRRRNIQYIPAHSIHALLPAADELYYQQRYYSIGDEVSPVKVRDILKGDVHHFQSLEIPPSFDVQSLLDRQVKQLSNGQLKKVLILQRLLHHLPKLLLLDYPFEGLDRDSRRDFCDFIDFVVKTYNVQIVIVDHGHELPECMTHRLTLEGMKISGTEKIDSDQRPQNHFAVHREHPSTGEVVVDIRDLKIQYGETVILKDFNWTVNRGDRWALVGANGSGKTTLFSIIFADHPMAYSQEVYLFGKKRGTGESIWDIKQRINYLGPELMSYLDSHSSLQTARQFIGEGDIDRIADFFEARSFIEKPLQQLSSGQLQLVLLMRCFNNTRELLLLDEPFQFLDPETRDRVAAYLQQFLSDGVTLILITHYEQDLQRWTEKTKRVG